MTRHRLPLIAVAITLAITSILAGCGIASSGELVEIDPGEIPYGLGETTTSTTSPPTTVVPTTKPDVTTTTMEPTTTIALEEVSLYFLTGSQLVPIQRVLVSPATPSQVFAALTEGPPAGEEGAGLRSAIPAGVEAEVTVSRGIATVDLSSGFFDDVPAADQRRAVAQIVLTISLLPRASLVVITEDGEPIAVPRGGGDLAEPGEPLTFEDYEMLALGTRGG
jgi:spore germination protein GerM